jgi:hypothetical protein
LKWRERFLRLGKANTGPVKPTARNKPIPSQVTQATEFQEETMSKWIIALATASVVAGCGIWRVEAATMTDSKSLVPLTKSYTPVEEVGYWRRHYRRGYYGYGGSYYGYGYRPYYGYGNGYRPYYGYGYYRPYGYGYGWRPGITIGIGPGWGWRY